MRVVSRVRVAVSVRLRPVERPWRQGEVVVTLLPVFVAGRRVAVALGLAGVLMASTLDDPESQARIAAFQQSLQQLGWSEGRNADIDQYLRRSRLGRSSGLGR